MIDIFLYNVVYIKCDFSKLRYSDEQKMVLIGSPYCLNELSHENRRCFDNIHEISRNFQQIDLIEVDKIVFSYVQQYGANNIRLLTNEDSAQLVCASLREKYNIPGPRTPELLPFVNKVISKEMLGNVVKMPKFTHFDKAEYQKNKEQYLLQLQEKLGFPMFAKPIDLVSSVETHFIADMDALSIVVERIMSHPYEFEIDEYIEGDLFHCDAMMINGSVEFFMIGKCSFALARFFDGKPVGSIPIADQNMFDDLRQFCNKVFDKLNCSSGAYHLEAFLDKKTQEFVFLEIGARTGGALITKVYEKLFDLNIEETNYLIQMGLIDKLFVAEKNIFAGFLNFPKIKGTVVDIKKPDIDISNEFIEFVKPNDKLEQAQNLLDISSSIIFWDESYQKVEAAFEFLKNYHPLSMATS
jgi:hypothetical protein